MKYIISSYKNKETQSIQDTISIDDVVSRIKNGVNHELVLKARYLLSEDDHDGYNEIKGKLPAYKFSGIFNGSLDKDITQHTGLICLDFDKYDSKDEMDSEFDFLKEDPFVMLAFRSPSNLGYKVVVKIPKSIEDHQYHFAALKKHFNQSQWDDKVKNVGRLCFHSYDPNLYYNPDSELFTEREDVIGKLIERSKVLVPIKSTNEIIRKIDVWFGDHFDSSARNASLIKLAFAHNRFGIIESECLSHLIHQYGNIIGTDGKSLSEKEISTIVKNAYKNRDEHATESFEDHEIVNKVRERLQEGETTPKIREDLKKDHEQKEVDIIIKKARSSRHQELFWEIEVTEKTTKIHIIPKQFKEFVNNSGFYKYYLSSGDYAFVRVNGKFVEYVEVEKIKSYVLDYLIDDYEMIYNHLANKNTLFTREYMNFIDDIHVEFIRDTKESAYLFFQNSLVEVTKTDVIEHDYIDFDRYVWKDQIIGRSFKKNGNECDFSKFIVNISNKENERIKSFHSLLGSLMHTYQIVDDMKAVIFYDEDISDNPEGGTGKGLLIDAVEKFKNVVIQDGKKFDHTKDFAYQRVKEDTQVFVIDDAKKGFNFEEIFSVITQGMSINRKNKDEIHIDKKDSPKIAISSNYIIKSEGGSFDRRKFEIELHNHYSATHRPKDDFGKAFFDEWDDKEWCAFDNFMITCIQDWLNNGFVTHKTDNFNQKRIIRLYSSEFIEWFDEYIVGKYNERLINSALHEQFLKDTDVQKTYWSRDAFTKKMRGYAGELVKQGDIDEVRKVKEGTKQATLFVKTIKEEEIPF